MMTVRQRSIASIAGHHQDDHPTTPHASRSLRLQFQFRGLAILLALHGLASSNAVAVDWPPHEDLVADHLGTPAGPDDLESRAGQADPLMSNWVQRDKLMASDGVNGDEFGQPVALDGDTALLMACGAEGGSSGYVYTRTNDIWSEQAKLTPHPVSACGGFFGGGVKLDGDTAVVATWYPGDPEHAGSFAIYTRVGEEWAEQAIIVADEGEGMSPIDSALDGDTLMALAASLDNPDFAVSVFTRSGGQWSEQAQITPPDGAAFLNLSAGPNVALDGDTALIVGGSGEQTTVYVFARDGGDWALEAELTPSDGADGLEFGYSVAVDGDTALVGASRTAHGILGKVYVYTRNGETWTEQAQLTSPVVDDANGDGNFGRSVALNGDTALVAAAGLASAFLFHRSGETWSAEATLTPVDGSPFAYDVALDGDTAIVGVNPGNIQDPFPAIPGWAYAFDTRESAPAIRLSPATVDFGEVPVGQSANDQAVTLENNGSAELHVGELVLSGDHAQDFDLVDDPCSGQTIGPGEACTVALRFSPTEVGDRVAALDVPSNAPTAPHAVLLEGQGSEGPPTMRVDPESLESTLPIDGSETLSLTVANLGSESLDWEVTEVAGLTERILRPSGGVTVPILGAAPAAGHGLTTAALEGAETVPHPFPTAFGTEVTITHSESMDVQSPSTIACATEGQPQFTRENQFLRTFTLADFDITGDFDVTEVTFGVETLTATADITVNLYTLDGPFTYANLTEIGSATQSLSAQSQTLVTVPVTGHAPAGSTLVVEIEAPDLLDVGAFFAGSNNLGETAPSYLASTTCGLPEPTPYAQVGGGFPDVHLVMAVTGNGDPLDCTLPDWASPLPTSGSVPGGEEQVVDVTFDATDLAPDDFAGNLCLASNDPVQPLTVVPLTLTVTVGGAELAFDPQSVDFGELEVGGTSPPQTAMLHNTGDVDVTGLAFSGLPAGGFEADTSACGDTLPVDGSCEVSVTFTPTAPGPATAALVASSAEGATAELPVAGSGSGGDGFTPMALAVDPVEMDSDGNGVFEPHEVVNVAPTWRNDSAASVSLTGTAADFHGPDGADYMLSDADADYGLIAPGAEASCQDLGVCYRLGVNDPAARPATHWEATFDETLSNDTTKTWSLHIGDSFADVSRESLFYGSIETLLHHGVTEGCTATEYCPAGTNSRAQMAAFLLRAAEGGDYTPPACEADDERFDDVPASSTFCPWIEELAARGVTSGCGGDNYCPGDSVTRAQMAVFLLKAAEGEGYTPPECTSVFTDVPCPSTFAAWIEDLANRGVTSGCGPTTYCPGDTVTRQQMAVFLSKTFGMTLYGP